jgi:dolichol-phosphate mannosyltransferase
MKTLICMPTYNEIENIREIIEAVHAVVPEFEILVIDDNSPDGTGQVADELAGKDDRIHVLHREGKEGLGKAYIAGFKWALERDYSAIFEMDADFSHQPKYLRPMRDALETFDVVVGSRYVAGGDTENWGFLRKLISKGGGLYARLILGLGVRDLTAGFVLWRREVLETMELNRIEASGYVFQIEMKYRAAQAGYRIHEHPIIFPDRVAGESKMSPDIALEAVTRVWSIRFRS